jgi:hypothetical protein
MRLFRAIHDCEFLLVGLLSVASVAHAGFKENLDEMSWVYNSTHIAMTATKAGVKLLEVDMGNGEPAARGDLYVLSCKFYYSFRLDVKSFSTFPRTIGLFVIDHQFVSLRFTTR